eukprot:GHVP01045729.1.p1 GENE.GHVP01045729.1~~GHVP01045729.1.p1  ORF type:complete len:141 (+),score=14.90 GHVP01045729.1:537-959(+)
MLSLDKLKEEKGDKVKYFGPDVILRKLNGAMCVTHDFSGLKNFTTFILWGWAAEQKYLIKLDFVKAFNLVLIQQEDSLLYEFIGPDGKTHKYVVLPLGTRNSPALFPEFLIKALEDILFKYPNNVKVYQDNTQWKKKQQQ